MRRVHPARYRGRRDGYVSKQELTETLLMAIRRVLRGETYAAPVLKARGVAPRAED